MRPLDFEHLVNVIAADVSAALHEPARCACHSAPSACCPSRVRTVLDAGAERLGVHAAGGGTGDIAALIDHTLLRPDAARSDIETLCREAVEYGFATVCVNPAWVALCAHLVRRLPPPWPEPRGRPGLAAAAERRRRNTDGRQPVVCSVVGFPLGATTPDVKAYETRRAIFDGAAEIDMVINVGALKSGDLRLVAADIEAVTDACRACGVLSKVIIEAALLTDEEKVAACTIAKAAGADYVKTSTGFGPGGATVHDVALMRRVVGASIGVKAAGGVRDLLSAREMVRAGATRVGASAGVRIVREAAGEPAAAEGRGY